LSPLALPDPVTIAFVGYWLAPTMIFAKGLTSFAPTSMRERSGKWLIGLNLVLGALGLVIWLIAIAHGRGEFLPPAASAIEYLLATSGLALLLGEANAADIRYRLREEIDFELMLTRWTFLGAIAGLILWGLNAGLH
jgi:hypothetical protein